MLVEKISRFQLAVLIMGFLFGVVINPASAAKQDCWIAYLASWVGGFFLLGGYVLIANLNSGETLIGILEKNFGRIIGKAIALLYIWYFMHLAAIVIRNFGEYIVITDYPETPITFTIIIMIITIAYAVRSGLEVMARTAEFFIPIIPVMVILVTAFLFQFFDINSYKPMLVRGLGPIIKTSIVLLGFPFGELVIFLMVFPALNRKKDLLTTSFLALFVMGTVLLIILLRNFFILGADMLFETIFPSTITTRLIPGYNLDAVVAVNYLIGGMCKVSICIYAATQGLVQVFNLNRYKLFVLPVSALVITVAIWLYDSTFETIRWSVENYFIYSFPFQIMIPGIVLIISIVKRASDNSQQL